MNWKYVLALFFFSSYSFGAVYDCFLFLNEAEILEIRLNELDPYVDTFVIVEARETFKGEKKPLHFDEIKERFAEFSHKIIHIVVDEHFETSNPWEREFFQRNQIMRALQMCKDEDIVFMSDVDEIVSPHTIPSILEKVSNDSAVVCEQQIYRYFLNREDTKLKHLWIGTVATTFRFIKTHPPQWLRDNRSHFEIIPDAGWHFTSMGGYERYFQKIISFSHTQEEVPIPTRQGFAAMVNQYQLVPIDDSFPFYVRNNIKYFEQLSLIDNAHN